MDSIAVHFIWHVRFRKDRTNKEFVLIFTQVIEMKALSSAGGIPESKFNLPSHIPWTLGCLIQTFANSRYAGSKQQSGVSSVIPEYETQSKLLCLHTLKVTSGFGTESGGYPLTLSKLTRVCHITCFWNIPFWWASFSQNLPDATTTDLPWTQNKLICVFVSVNRTNQSAFYWHYPYM